MIASPRPIGVFDSGIGGLTVLRALRRRMPLEPMVYFGDTAHVPYGSKSKETVACFAVAAGGFLAGRGIRLLVVACNTASALALEEIRAALRIPVVGVIEPGVRAAARGSRTGRIGIIATEATIASGAYQRALKVLLPKGRFFSVACPLFVPLAEEGLWSHPATRSIAGRYLRPLLRKRIDTLILGCTHYPLLKAVLRQIAGPGVRLIDSAEEVAREVETLLGERRTPGPRLVRGRASRGPCRFYASDGPERFLRLARRLLGFRVRDVRLHRLDGYE